MVGLKIEAVPVEVLGLLKLTQGFQRRCQFHGNPRSVGAFPVQALQHITGFPVTPSAPQGRSPPMPQAPARWPALKGGISQRKGIIKGAL